MRKRIFIIAGFLVLFVASSGLAQRGEIYIRRNVPLSESPCWTKPYWEATPDQLKELEILHRSFHKEISSVRNDYINLHYEIRSLMEGPKPERRMILEKQNHFSDLQKKMDEISIRHLLTARGLFNSYQLSRLPSGCNLGFNYGQGAGWGMRPRNRF